MEFYDPVDDISSGVGKAVITARDRRDVPVADLKYLSNSRQFLSPRNVEALTYQLYAIHRNGGGKMSMKDMFDIVSNMAREWSFGRQLNNLNPHIDWVRSEAIGAYNDMFIQEVKHFFEGETINIADLDVPSVGKKGRDMLAEDYQQLRFGLARPVYITDDIQRYGNGIPIWQRLLGKKMYDPIQDDAHLRDPEQASYGNQLHGFDMRKVRSQTGAFKGFRCLP